MSLVKQFNNKYINIIGIKLCQWIPKRLALALIEPHEAVARRIALEAIDQAGRNPNAAKFLWLPGGLAYLLDAKAVALVGLGRPEEAIEPLAEGVDMLVAQFKLRPNPIPITARVVILFMSHRYIDLVSDYHPEWTGEIRKAAETIVEWRPDPGDTEAVPHNLGKLVDRAIGILEADPAP